MGQLKGTGKASRATIAGVTITASDILEIAYDTGQDNVDSSGMGQTWRTHEVTLKGMTFTINGFADINTQAAIDAASLQAAMNAARTDSDGKFTFSLYVTGITGGSQEVTGTASYTTFAVRYPNEAMATINGAFLVDGTPTFEAGPS